MNTLLVILGFQISLGLLEVLIFQIGAVILGFSIHFFFTSRKSMRSAQKSALPAESAISEADEWRLRYYEQVDLQKKWEEETRKELEEKQEHEQLLNKELEETRSELELKQDQEYRLSKKLEEKHRELEEKHENEHLLNRKLDDAKGELESKQEFEYLLNKKVEEKSKELEEKQQNEYLLSRKLEETCGELQIKLEHESILTKKLEDTQNELAALRDVPAKPIEPDAQAGEYLAQLATAQMNFLDHNQRITRLLEQIELLKDSERKHLDTKQANEALQMQLRDFRQALSDKESEIKQIRQQQLLIHELKERLEKAHDEYNVLQEKLQKLETHISKPQNRTFEYEELQQSYFKLTKECDEIKMKQLSMLEENQRLSRLLADTEDKLRESNFQRQQYLRKVTFLEELNHDLQELSGHHKKLESQMRRIGEIEMILNRSAENK
ncbi:MAG: hypothetical protein H7122_00140 [Chitinophagaceae bacterium]|nr:hypothetical protein [Chitinophagaceae bacterium]